MVIWKIITDIYLDIGDKGLSKDNVTLEWKGGVLVWGKVTQGEGMMGGGQMVTVKTKCYRAKVVQSCVR